MPTHREGRLLNRHGLELFFQSWQPDARPARGVLLNVHGLGDHSGLHPAIAEYFPAHGWAVYGIDLRGHGRSAGQRAYVARWRDYLDDVAVLLARVDQERSPGPRVLLGHSLGGLVALDFGLQFGESIAGVIAAAPPLGEVGVPRHLLLLGRLLSRVLPRFSLEVGMDLSNLSRDPAVVPALLADPLFHRRGTARLATEVTAAIARIQASAASLRVPALLLHGGADRMVPADGSRIFAARAHTAELREYPLAYHALFADLDSADVLADVTRWLEARLPC
jgi:alpha-beta hydrolase superfamily lysophospholipase